MIISFDGNTYLGKTSVINMLKVMYPESKVYREYDTDPDMLINRTHLETQKYYFGLEAERNNEDKEGQLVLLDRSYLSLLAHSYAVSLMEKKNRLVETVELLRIQRRKGKVVCQHAAVLFIQPKDRRSYSDVDKKGGEKILYDSQYRAYIDRFYEEIIQIILKRGTLGLGVLSRVYLWENGMWDDLFQWLETCVNSKIKKSADEETDLFQTLLFAAEEIVCRVSRVYDK